MYCNELKEFAQEQEQKLISALADTREHPSPDGETRSRDNYQRDYARILYSSSFRRLQGKMQLFEIDPEKFNRNRLTHSLEVAQIARSIASDLKLINPVVVELAALAHDIGNPPFGHSGEKLLNELSEEIGGYEGNAQALRILRKLEKKFSYCNGLNLTHRSLLSVVKYPIPRAAATAGKFIYDDDYYFYINLLAENQLDLNPGEKTIDAQIMDFSRMRSPMPRMTSKMPLAGTWSRLKILNMSFRFLTNSGERGNSSGKSLLSREHCFSG